MIVIRNDARETSSGHILDTIKLNNLFLENLGRGIISFVKIQLSWIFHEIKKWPKA